MLVEIKNTAKSDWQSVKKESPAKTIDMIKITFENRSVNLELSFYNRDESTTLNW